MDTGGYRKGGCGSEKLVGKNLHKMEEIGKSWMSLLTQECSCCWMRKETEDDLVERLQKLSSASLCSEE